mmetsp:Transcript_55442/g.161912  ORF Transcript_55442/g.161912 Transcript_55442/m.161912 type:complete len:598 (-) Transcript_55442:78-1871(-)
MAGRGRLAGSAKDLGLLQVHWLLYVLLGARGGASSAAEDGNRDVEYRECATGEAFIMLSSVPPEAVEPAAGEEPCAWRGVPGAAFLPGYATGRALAARSLIVAQSHCAALGDDCAGVTLQPCETDADVVFTLRSEAQPHTSPHGEASWLKVCGDGAISEEASVLAFLAQEEPDDSEGDEETGLAASDAACNEERFARMREAAVSFYEAGVVSVHLLLFLGEVLREAASGGWARVLARCAPGALQTLLLRAEERLFVDPAEYQSLLDLYLGALHRALDVLSPDAWAAWPLAKGWARLARLQRALAPRRRHGGATVDFVLCFCGVSRSPGGGYPAVEDDLGWLVRLLAPGAAEHRHRTRIFIKEKCGDAVDGRLENSLRAVLEPVAHVVDVERVEDELRADDATAYLAHLGGDHYDDLASWTFFLHADAPEHILPFRLLEEVFAAVHSSSLNEEDFPFLYLSHNYLDLGKSRHTWDDHASPSLWRRLFGSSVAPPREAVKGYCCVQFLVPRPRARLRPRSWYQHALQWFASAESYWRLFPAGHVVTWQDLTCRAPAQLWMPWWHVVFGEPLASPERHLDPRLPLFVQLRSIPPDRIHCC